MPRVPVPPEVDAFLAEPNPAVVATVSPSGAPHTAATWYDWEDGRVFLNMDESRLRLRYMRENPAIALTRPWHVNVDEIVVKARNQSSGGRILRDE